MPGHEYFINSAIFFTGSNRHSGDSQNYLPRNLKKIMKNRGHIILSIELAIEGGSLSLSRGKQEIDFWVGTREVSKAEDVLEQIAILLKKNTISIKQIETIIVSNNFGSLTGAKIGQAIAQGLKKAINCKIVRVPILQALAALTNADFEGEILTALPLGRNNIGWQTFRKNKLQSMQLFKPSIEPQISTAEAFTKTVDFGNYGHIILHDSISRIFSVNRSFYSTMSQKTLIAGRNLAFIIAKAHTP